MPDNSLHSHDTVNRYFEKKYVSLSIRKRNLKKNFVVFYENFMIFLVNI